MPGFTSGTRWLRHAHSHLRHLFPRLPQQPGYNTRYFRGLRLHLACPLHGLPVAFALTGAKADERKTLLDLLAVEPLRQVIESVNETFKTQLDPDRASFSIALDAARDQVILAAGITAGTTIELAGRIGEQVLASLIPVRRLRTQPPRRQARHRAAAHLNYPVLPLAGSASSAGRVPA